MVFENSLTNIGLLRNVHRIDVKYGLPANHVRCFLRLKIVLLVSPLIRGHSLHPIGIHSANFRAKAYVWAGSLLVLADDTEVYIVFWAVQTVAITCFTFAIDGALAARTVARCWTLILYLGRDSTRLPTTCRQVNRDIELLVHTLCSGHCNNWPPV